MDAYIVRRGSGGSPTKSVIIVTAPTGSTVTCTKGTTVKTATEKNGEWWFKNLDIGTWTLKATLSGQTATQTVNVTQFGVYRVTMSYFKSTIKVTYPAGSTCTCSKGGKTFTAPNTSGSYTFTVDSAGTWIVKCTDEGLESSGQVTISSNGEAKSITLDYIVWIVKNGVELINLSTYGNISKTVGDGYILFTGGGVGFHGGYASVGNLPAKSDLIIEGTLTIPQITSDTRLAIWDNSTTPNNTNALKSADFTSTAKSVLDLSEYSGSYKVGFITPYTLQQKITNLYLKPKNSAEILAAFEHSLKKISSLETENAALREENDRYASGMTEYEAALSEIESALGVNT